MTGIQGLFGLFWQHLSPYCKKKTKKNKTKTKHARVRLYEIEREKAIDIIYLNMFSKL